MASLRPAVVLISIAAIVWPQGALAWRLASHSLSAQAAAAMLPPGMPGFFRTAHAELAYICNDPDRWRTRSRGRAPALVAMDFPNHWFQLERHPALLPPTRQEFIMRLAASGQLIPGKQTIRDFGTADDYRRLYNGGGARPILGAPGTTAVAPAPAVKRTAAPAKKKAPAKRAAPRRRAQ